MKKKNTTNYAPIARKAYEAKVGLEALNRAGHCPQLKGHVCEILVKDQFNANPANFLQGKHAALTKSPTAQMRDIVVTKGGKIAGHMQVKDTVSNSGALKTAKQLLPTPEGKVRQDDNRRDKRDG